MADEKISFTLIKINKGKVTLQQHEDVSVNTPLPLCERIRTRLEHKIQSEIKERQEALDYLRKIFSSDDVEETE